MRRPWTGPCLVALVLLAACEIPTALPIYDTMWSVPAKSTSISINTLLPPQVTPTSDNSAFQVTLSPSSASFTRSLAQDCAACGAANGLTVPKPPFSAGGSTSLAFPSSVSSATLVRDTLAVTITNGFNFDPLRPSASARGYLVIAVQNGSTVVGRDSVDGASTALPASGTLVRKIPLSGTIAAASGLQIGLQVNSPLGDPVAIDASRTISVSGSVGTVFVSSAKVNVTNQAVSATPSSLNLSGIDSSITKRAGGATLELTVNNPIAVSGNLVVTLNGATPITKTVALSGGTSAPSVPFTQSEVRSLLGQNVTMSVNGTVGGSNVTVQPGQTLSVSSRFVLTLTVGGK